VVSGDLSQQLGSPVEKGKVLFEIAPLDSYRVILNVDERDISQIEVGQQGSLALSGMPYNVMHFAVKQVTPVATSKDGSNYFRVEAQIDEPSERLRPGMEGVGKVSVGERKLIWIFTHSLFDWFRLWSWKWMP
jgi:multidrug efflux pump subunit AcrA (membrane-fusion protein)